MYLNLKKLFHLPVVTESGTNLGKVHDVELDIEAHSVRHYIVEHGFVGKEFFLVAPAQVKSITAEKIVVDDSVVSESVDKKAKNEQSSPQPALGGALPTIVQDK